MRQPKTVIVGAGRVGGVAARFAAVAQKAARQRSLALSMRGVCTTGTSHIV